MITKQSTFPDSPKHQISHLTDFASILEKEEKLANTSKSKVTNYSPITKGNKSNQNDVVKTTK